MDHLLDNQFVESTINKAVRDFLFIVKGYPRLNLFSGQIPEDYERQNQNKNAFFVINPNNDNYNFVSLERFLEGCIRVFLVNPIIKDLLDHCGYRNDWQFGKTFNNFQITNREYELGAFVEFIFECNGRAIGCRYTTCGYLSYEPDETNRDIRYLYEKEKIPGFYEIPTVDSIYFIDWSGITSSKRATIHGSRQEKRKDITLENFFALFFSRDSYQIFVEKCKNAIKQAKEILSFKAVPQLMPNNMVEFKDSVLQEFSKEKIKEYTYQFNEENTEEKPLGQISDDDLSIMDSFFYGDGLCEAIIGTSSFSKSFITSEYLFNTTDKRLEIDYTAVVVGYLKSIEQLLDLFYRSFFGNESKAMFWDFCPKSSLEKFNLLDNRYRKNKYWKNGDDKKEEKLKFFSHNKKIGRTKLDELINFLRYNADLWRISESGKEYVYSCLDDFRSFSRNRHFHKDNIERDNYQAAKTIRNNARVCLYYLLGGFKLLKVWDDYKDTKEVLGIKDYSFERFFNSIPMWRGLCRIKTGDGREKTGIFSRMDYSPNYNNFDKDITHIYFIELSEEEYQANSDETEFDKQFLDNHHVKLTRESMPITVERVRSRKKHKVEK